MDVDGDRYVDSEYFRNVFCTLFSSSVWSIKPLACGER